MAKTDGRAKKETNPYDYRAFYRDLRGDEKAGLSPRLYPVYVLEGEEEYVKERALSDLTDAVLSGPMKDMNVNRLTDPDAGAIIAANETLPLMAPRRLVIVRESGMLSGKAGDYDEKASADRLKDYFAHLPDTSSLVFYVRGGADGRKSLVRHLKDLAGKGQCAYATFSSLTEAELQAWILHTGKERGVKIGRQEASFLIFCVGSGLSRVRSETEKLCDYLGPDTAATEDDIRQIVTKSVEYRVFDMAGVILEGNGPQAFRMLNGLLFDGEQRLMLLALLSRQCRQLLQTALLTRQGQNAYQIAGVLGIPSGAVSQLQRLCRRFTLQDMTKMNDLCLQTEYAVKSGRMPEEGSLEKVMLQILSMGGGHG